MNLGQTPEGIVTIIPGMLLSIVPVHLYEVQLAVELRVQKGNGPSSFDLLLETALLFHKVSLCC